MRNVRIGEELDTELVDGFWIMLEFGGCLENKDLNQMLLSIGNVDGPV